VKSLPRLGVGLQYNPEILGWFPFEQQPVDAFEILLDSIMGRLDGPYLMAPGASERLAALRQRAPLLAHSNYGCEFGFGPLERSPAVLRHVALAQALGSPWVSNHCFYADDSWSDVWSSPLQFSRAEVQRVAARARELQNRYGIPLAHENAAYYVACPGADLSEAEFLRRVTELAGTYLHLDLHNVYTNSVNHPGFRADQYLATIPLERVIVVHIAGGSWSRGFYHDWHDSKVPAPVWEMLQQVLETARPSAVILEFQGRAHHPDTRVLTREQDLELITADLSRAQRLWDHVYGPGSRHSTRSAAA
jgi:uncharacterized protein